MSEGAVLDLVCGPASPLPETYQRYRLVAHLGSGGQAEVYRAVRLSGGVSSAPMTVKVFRVDPCRPLVDELRSWDKGDATLMDLNNRGVAGICRRADGFYGPPPHRPGQPPSPGDAVPYQIYDYLHGVDLRQFIQRRIGHDPTRQRLNAIESLRMLASVLNALHNPQEPSATPVLHMDVKPANVMVLTNGDIRLIDFTGARYWREGEITQISYTRESGGPEAFGGASHMGPAYDVHGFGAVAFYLVTGLSARVDVSDEGASAHARPRIRQIPLLDQYSALRDHLYAPLSDSPSGRPKTIELHGWVDQLGQLVRRGGLPDLGLDWAEPHRSEVARAIGRATPHRVVNGTETSEFQRIERLERELVELRGSADNPVLRGRASVPVPQRPTRTDAVDLGPGDEPEPWRGFRIGDPGVLKRGWKMSGVGALMALISWGIWVISNGGRSLSFLVVFVIVPCVAVGVFCLSRFIGYLVLEQQLGRVRRSAWGSHAITGIFLGTVGLAYLQRTPWLVRLWEWVTT